MEPLPLRIDTRNGCVVATVSRHCWQSNTQTVGSGAEMVGNGVGLRKPPANVRTGSALPSAVPWATGFGDEPIGSAAVALWAPRTRTSAAPRAIAWIRRLGVRSGRIEAPRSGVRTDA